MSDNTNLIQKYNKRLEALKSERSSFVPLWRELSDYHLNHRGRFLTSNRNKGHKRNTNQINNTSRMALRTLASGMMSGITSPARPWFRLTVSDPQLKENASVKSWLHEVERTMYEVFSKSNFYNSIHSLYLELGTFGTAAMGIFSDFDNVIHCQTYTVGSYMIAANAKNEIDTFYREYQLTVGQVVKQFGYENCSTHVQSMWDNGNTEAWVDIVHVVEPNDSRDHMSPLAKDMPFRSVYYEKGTTTQKNNQFLRQSGFKYFPIVAPRWEVVGEDIYGVDCPGITALGDTKSLQLGEKRKYQALDKLVNPPLQGPSIMQQKVGETLSPGQIVWTDSNGDGLRSIYQFNPDLNAIMAINQEAENRIKRSFYEDLFLMLSTTDRRQITAREVAERHEEKLLMLGPVLERLHSELLDPLINITFFKLQDAGVLPVPPEDIQGLDLNVEYISILAQAQRLVSVGALERMGQYVAGLAQIYPDVRHKFDAEQAVDEYSEALGVTPSVIRSDDKVQQIIQQERAAVAQQQQMAQAEQAAKTAKTMSDTKIEDNNAIGKLMQQMGL